MLSGREELRTSTFPPQAPCWAATLFSIHTHAQPFFSASFLSWVFTSWAKLTEPSQLGPSAWSSQPPLALLVRERHSKNRVELYRARSVLHWDSSQVWFWLGISSGILGSANLTTVSPFLSTVAFDRCFTGWMGCCWWSEGRGQHTATMEKLLRIHANKLVFCFSSLLKYCQRCNHSTVGKKMIWLPCLVGFLLYPQKTDIISDHNTLAHWAPVSPRILPPHALGCYYQLIEASAGDETYLPCSMEYKGITWENLGKENGQDPWDLKWQLTLSTEHLSWSHFSFWVLKLKGRFPESCMGFLR